MCWRACVLGIAIVGGDVARGEDVVTAGNHAGGTRFAAPLTLMQAQSQESVYAPPEPRDPQEGVNEGGVTLDLTVSYLTDYVLRGIDFGEFAASTKTNPLAPPSPNAPFGQEDAPNLQLDGQVTLDLGKIPSPFFGVFVNVFDADPESRFQEIRPFFGVQLTLRPITFAAGHNSYIYPDRDDLNTTEVFGKLTVDDSYFFLTDEPILSPYVFAAYDYDVYDGLYTEAGVEHDFDFEAIGIVLTAQASIAYVTGHQLFALTEGGDDTGLQHYRLGLIGRYDLNDSLGIPLRYGRWTFNGYLFYVDGLENDLRAETQVFGGAGIGFSY